MVLIILKFIGVMELQILLHLIIKRKHCINIHLQVFMKLGLAGKYLDGISIMKEMMIKLLKFITGVH